MQIPSHHLWTHYYPSILYESPFFACFLFSILVWFRIQKRRSEHKPWKKFNYYSIIWMWTVKRIFGRENLLHSISMGKWNFYIPHPYHILWCHWNHFAFYHTPLVSQFLPSYFSWVFYILKVNKAVRISNTNNREEQQCGRLLGKQRLTNIAEQL